MLEALATLILLLLVAPGLWLLHLLRLDAVDGIPGALLLVATGFLLTMLMYIVIVYFIIF